ncbi:MAG: hypothetical protein J3Q66DRAFT_362933 [Benniella sp.]|nr:MAG: hypothetical protein J3Q66DRAFT_362933 [Benniella sp.]
MITTTNSSFAMWQLPLLLHTWPRPHHSILLQMNLQTIRSRSLLESFQSELSMTMFIHHHGYGSETGKELEDEEESEIKDTAAHKSNLPGRTIPETVWPQQMQQDEAVRDKGREGDLPGGNLCGGSTTVRATGGDTSQVVVDQPYQSQYRHQTTTEPVIHKAYDDNNRGESDHGDTADTATGAAGTGWSFWRGIGRI